MATVDKTNRRNNTDRRVKRTKNALRNSLLTLLKTKSVNEITVTELTELADVNRATFYFYYNDIIDMVKQVQEEAIEGFAAIVNKMPLEINTSEDFTVYIVDILEHVRDNVDICRFVLDNDINFHAEDKLSKLLISRFVNSTKYYDDTCAAHYITRYGLHGAMGVVVAWMNDGMKTEINELADFLTEMYLYGARKVRETHKDLEKKI